MEDVIAKQQSTEEIQREMMRPNLHSRVLEPFPRYELPFRPERNDSYEVFVHEGEVVRVDLACPLGVEEWTVSIVLEQWTDDWVEAHSSPIRYLEIISGEYAKVFEQRSQPGGERVEIKIPESSGYYDGRYYVFVWNKEKRLICRPHNRKISVLPGNRPAIQRRKFGGWVRRWSATAAVVVGIIGICLQILLNTQCQGTPTDNLPPQTSNQVLRNIYEDTP